MTVRKRYEAMRDALNATGRPILFSMCEWGVSSPWEYGHEVHHGHTHLLFPVSKSVWYTHIEDEDVANSIGCQIGFSWSTCQPFVGLALSAEAFG
jgi:hypothetical protein